MNQISLLRIDEKLMGYYAREGKADLAEEKQRDFLHRIDVLEKQWNWVLERYPHDPRATNYYGELLYDYGHDEQRGFQMWMTAVGLDENCAPAHNNLGVHYFHTGNYAEGLRHLQRALDLEKDNPDYLFNMAQMYLIYFDKLEGMLKMSKEKLYKEAMRMSGKAADLAPDDFDLLQDYAVNFYAAENFGVEADWSDAAAAWNRAVPHARTEDEKFYALLNVGRAWIRASRPQDAVPPLEQAVQLKRDSDAAKQLLAKAKGEAD